MPVGKLVASMLLSLGVSMTSADAVLLLGPNAFEQIKALTSVSQPSAISALPMDVLEGFDMFSEPFQVADFVEKAGYRERPGLPNGASALAASFIDIPDTLLVGLVQDAVATASEVPNANDPDSQEKRGSNLFVVALLGAMGLAAAVFAGWKFLRSQQNFGRTRTKEPQRFAAMR